MTRSDLSRTATEGFDEYLTRVCAIVTEYEQLSEGHIRWFTHKNPYGCWICDVFSLLRKIVEEVEILERNQGDKEDIIYPSPQASKSIKDEDNGEC